MTHRDTFDIGWLFHLGDGGGQGVAHDDSAWRKLNLPHDWSIELPRSPDYSSGSSGGFFADGVGWYRKHFIAPESWQGKNVTVEFEGIYQNAELWLNDHCLGRHPYGYTSFHVDLTPFLVFGADNVLTVCVDNGGLPHTRWYSGSGIYRHSWLTVAEPVHVAQWGVYVTTPEVTAEQAVVSASVTGANHDDVEAAVQVKCTVFDPDGMSVGTLESAVTIPGDSTADAVCELSIPTPQLWDPDNPALYSLVAEIVADGQITDRVETPFGVRTFRFTPAEGFVLNGDVVLLRGGCVHHDCGPLGSAAIDRAEERKVELLKASGYNAVRCAHNPPSPAFLDACDRLGMLVIDEAFDVWQAEKKPHDYHRFFDDWWQRDLDSMLMRDRNHPSIVLWSIGNELIERARPEGRQIARMLAERVRAVEPSRPVTAGICNVWDGTGSWRDLDAILAELDVHGYNYEVDQYESDHELFANRVIIATESFPYEQFKYWKAVETLPHVAGDFVWTSLDYLGEAGIGREFRVGGPEEHVPRWPWHHANCGDIDLCGWKRPQSFYRDVLWGCASKPYIAVHPPRDAGVETGVTRWGWHDVQACWDWPVDAGRLRVDVYCEADRVELFLNGDSIGLQPATEAQEYIATFDVPYQPGVLKAVATHQGSVVGESTLSTGSAPIGLRLTADRDHVEADRNELVYVTVEGICSDGTASVIADNMAFFTVTGPARIRAVASADPRSEEPYVGNARSLWRGRGLVILQPTGDPGEITLRAQADGLDGAELIVQASRMVK